MGTAGTPSISDLNRTHQRIKDISAFFRARIPAQQSLPERSTISTIPDIPPPTLIPIQVLMMPQQAAVHTAAPPPEEYQQPTPSQHPRQPNMQQQLQHAQTVWATMFRTSQETTPSDGHRPTVLSVENQRSNESWGDQLAGKPDNVTRIYGMNVNGLTLDQKGGQLDVLCKVINEPDVFCGQEHNLDSNGVHTY
jgi:hypothetical protein